jgi:hypothetical protein
MGRGTDAEPTRNRRETNAEQNDLKTKKNKLEFKAT